MGKKRWLKVGFGLSEEKHTSHLVAMAVTTVRETTTQPTSHFIFRALSPATYPARYMMHLASRLNSFPNIELLSEFLFLVVFVAFVLPILIHPRKSEIHY